MKKKVYCKNCRNVDIEYVAGRQMEKNPPFNFYPYSKLFCKITHIYTGCDDERNLNLKNNCPHYKPKWWKFWLK